LRRYPKPLVVLLALLAGALPLASCAGYGKPNQPGTELAFGVDMARRGLWNEALFRFHEAERGDPENPRVQNNLGVAYEAQGDFESALAHYKRALQLAPENREVRANYARFVEFYQAYKAPDKKGKSGLIIPKAKEAAGKTGTSGRPGDRPPPNAPPSGPPEPSNSPPRPGGVSGPPAAAAPPVQNPAANPPPSAAPSDQPPPPSGAALQSQLSFDAARPPVTEGRRPGGSTSAGHATGDAFFREVSS